MLGFLVIFSVALSFIVLERVRPGRPLPKVRGWYARAILINTAQLLITVFSGKLYYLLFPTSSLLDIKLIPPYLQGFIAWFIGTFAFYWWHRLRHKSNICWRIFHQIHHSPSRIEVLTSFYKHPLEILVNALISNFIIYFILGCSIEGAVWYNIFAASGEMFYHSNLSTPRWMGYFMQRPEHHSIHHQYNLHDYNYGDITLWDRIFGTFKDAEKKDFSLKCGFNEGKERNLGKMLLFKDNY
jgi:sterol desaturase/sphingolipid hydroxylase (fatty acid hydroxylase superfamily)